MTAAVLRTLALLAVAGIVGLSPLGAGAVNVERVISPQGIEAWLVREPANPIIAINFAFRGGAALDPTGKAGLAHFVAVTMDEGGGDLDSQAFQKALEDKAIRLHFKAGLDTFGGHLETLTRHRDAAFRLLSMALQKPRFDKEAVERLRAQILVGIERDEEDPNALARRALRRALFPDHPYGRPVQGTEDSVKRISRRDLSGFVRRRLARDNVLIGVVGDITPDVLAPLLDKTFAGLPPTATPWQLSERSPVLTGATVFIDRDIPQSTLRFADLGVLRGDPDFYAAYVMNHILGGGGFTSRLYAEIREQRGLAYSVYSSLWPLAASAALTGGLATATGRVKEALEVLRQQWQYMAENGVTEAELNDAKTYLIGAFPLRFTANGRTADMLVGLQIAHLDRDYLKRRNALINAVGRDHIRRIARKLLSLRRLTVVVVGRREGKPMP